jgi:RHS repeat-associated protein
VIGQTLQKGFIPLPGGGTAVYTPTGLTYIRHSDHLGSSRLATTPNQTLYSSTAYAPFGEPYKQSGTTDLSFTGQDQDTVSGMYDFWARKYTATSGRWLTPDPAGISAVDPANPQTWNRYAYVMNSPLNLTDPLGEDCYLDGTCRYTGGINPLVVGGGWADPFQVMSANFTPTAILAIQTEVGPQWYWYYPFSAKPVTVDVGQGGGANSAANNCQAPFLCNPVPPKPKKVGPAPLKWWEKTGMVLACIAGMDPEFATPMGAADSQPSDSTDSTNTTEGQGPPLGPNKGGRMVPYGGSPEVPSGAAGGAAYGAGVGQCIANVFTTWPK